MRTVVFAFTQSGADTARRIAEALREGGGTAEIRVPPRLSDGVCAAYGGDLPTFVGGVFDRDALVFVGACGIAVRAVAPHVRDKRSDPAVVCVDEHACFVIPVLSGHIGGANRLTRFLAEALNAIPVITTATDVNERFSVDAWAAERDMHIVSMALAKRVSAEILSRDVPFYSDAPGMPAPEEMPGGLVWAEDGELGICVSPRDLKPFDETLLLVPKALCLGIGCRRGAGADAIEALIQRVFCERGLRIEAVAEAASIDVKADEEGLRACCAAHGWPLRFYSAERLNAVPGSFTGSDFVKGAVGVDNVCERAALAEGGTLIVPKTAMDGVTVAVAERKWGIGFGQDSRGGHRPRRL